MGTVKIYAAGIGEVFGGTGGAYAAILTYGDKKKRISGTVDNTTKNQIELIAVLEAMKTLKASGKTKEIQIFTNSDYVDAGFNLNLGKWKRNGWKTAKKKPIKNKAQWKGVDQFLEYFPKTIVIKAIEEANMDRAIALAKAQQREGILNGSIVPKTKKGYQEEATEKT